MVYTIICAGRQTDKQTDSTTERQTDKHIKKYNTKTVARAAVADTAAAAT